MKGMARWNKVSPIAESLKVALIKGQCVELISEWSWGVFYALFKSKLSKEPPFGTGSRISHGRYCQLASLQWEVMNGSS